MTTVRKTENPQDGYHAVLDMGTDGRVTLDLMRAHTQSGRAVPELLLTHEGTDVDGKYRSVVLALDLDFARIYGAFVEDAVRALVSEVVKPSAAPRFIAPPEGPEKKGGRR